jgi:hypothetical protein
VKSKANEILSRVGLGRDDWRLRRRPAPGQRPSPAGGAERAKGAAATQSPASAAAQTGSPAPERSATVADSELRRRRARLAAEFVELQWDLGGIAYEMASRDHFRVDVLSRQAAKLQQVDAELAEAERMLRLEDAGAAGTCESCGALYARGSAFCWQCGRRLIAESGADGAASR